MLKQEQNVLVRMTFALEKLDCVDSFLQCQGTGVGQGMPKVVVENRGQHTGKTVGKITSANTTGEHTDTLLARFFLRSWIHVSRMLASIVLQYSVAIQNPAIS